MNLNEELFLTPTICVSVEDKRFKPMEPQETQPARVIHINEAHGFFVAEFTGPRGRKFREAFPLPTDQRQERKLPAAPDRFHRHGPQFGRKRPQ